MIAGIRRGLDMNAMKTMQLGQLVDYCAEYDNQEHRAEKKEQKPSMRKATQAEIDAFLG